MPELTDEKMQEIMAYEPDFTLFGMIDLEKSAATENAEKRIVFGEISNTQKDEQGERLMQKSLDFSYFDTNGVIKYEHLPKNSPLNIIGFPHERFTNENSTVIKGALFKKHKMADATWEMLQAVEQHNKEFPEFQKTVGWSVEGSYGNKRTAGGGLVKSAKIVNVVITPNPILKSTYLKLVEQHNAPIFKSLCATPAETDIPAKTGGDVIVEDNIDTNVKVTVRQLPDDIDDKKKKKKKSKNDKNNKEEYVMKSFNTYEEAVAHFVELGKTQDEAEELAKSLDMNPSTAEEESEETVESLTTEIKKTGTLLKSVLEFFKSSKGDDDEDNEKGDDDEDNEKGDDDIEKSLEMEVDATEFLKSMDDTNREILDTIHSQNEGLSKSFEGVYDMIEKIAGHVETLEKSLTIEGHPIAEAVQVMMKSRAGVSIADLQRFIPKTDGGQQAEITDAEIGNFSELHARLEKGVTEKKIDLNEMGRAETAFRLRDFSLVKSTLNKCI